MTCSRCHEDLEPWWSWCPFCGARTKVRPSAPSPPPKLAIHDIGFTIGRYWPTEAAYAMDTSDA